MHRLVPLVLAGTLLFAACGGDESSDAAGDSIVLPPKQPAAAATDSTTAPTAVDPAADVSTDTAADGPQVAPIEFDPCLVGTWNVSEATIGQLIATALLPVPDLVLQRGGFTVTLLDDGTASGDADFTAAFTVGDSPSEADVVWNGTGEWSTFDGVITLALGEQTGGLTELRLGGVAQPDSGFEIDLPLSGGPYTCTDSTLEVTGTAASTTIPLLLER